MRSAVFALYASAILQGMTLVSFPASSSVLKAMHGFSDAAYGAIFLPQVVLAVVGALGGGLLARRMGLRAVLVLCLVANGLSQLLLGVSSSLAPDSAYALVLLGTASLGCGFGLSGAPFNSYPGLLFPARAGAALVALHSCLGLGLALGPALVAGFLAQDAWLGFPLMLLGLALLLAVVSARVRLPVEPEPLPVRERRAAMPLQRGPLALLGIIAVLYAFAEGTLSNWVVLFVQEDRGLGAVVASQALSLFWAALVAGRLLVSVLLLRLPAILLWRLLPGLVLVAFLLLPQVQGTVSALVLFAFAGLACSGFFPLTVAIAAGRYPQQVPLVSSLLTAALMVGVGLGSFLTGALSRQVPLQLLYPLSAVYPALVLALMVVLGWLDRRGKPVPMVAGVMP